MPVSRGRKVKAASRTPNTPQSSHPVPTHRRSDVLLHRAAIWLGANLHKILERAQSILTFERLFRWGAFAVTFSAAALFFLPRVTVESSGPYDPSNPSPITFTIANNNIVPLRNVEALIGVCSLKMPDAPHTPHIILKGTGSTCNGPENALLTNPGWLVRWLDADEKWQIAIEDQILGGKQVEEANITIAVKYTPWWMPWFWRNSKQFRFVTKKRSDGKIYWVPTPLTH
jgi:hypothetical protein